MKNMFFLFTALLGLSLSTAVKADNYYAGILAGPNWVNSSSHSYKNHWENYRHHIDVDFDTGYVVGANLGYTWCYNFSVEGEFTYRKNNVDKVKFKRGKEHCDSKEMVAAKAEDAVETEATKNDGHKKNKNHSSGYLQSYAIMANARYDMPIDCCFTPYFRAGIGYASSKIHHNKNKDWNNNNHCGKEVASKDAGHHEAQKCKNHNNHTKNGFAYQVGVGVSFPICDNTTLDVGYNFLRAQKEINNQSLIFAAKVGF